MRNPFTAFGRFFFALILLALPFRAHALGLEIGAGIAQSRDHGNGTWYQNGFPSTKNLTSPSFLVGVRGNVTPWLAWHVDGVYLGRYSVDSQDTPNDANYSITSSTHCNGNCLPLAHYMGSGTVYGIAATLEAHTQGTWQFGVEAGPFLYHRSWSLSVPNWYSSTEVSPGVFVQSSPISPISTNDSGWAIGGVVGASVQYQTFGLSLRYYSDGKGFPRGNDPWPPIWKNQIVIAITKVFNF